MRPVCRADAIRAAEEAYWAVHPGADLMGRAAEQVAAAALGMLGDRQQVLVLVGPGHNGGDGLFAGAALAKSGRRVRLWITGSSAHGAGLAAAQAAGCVPLSGAAALERLPRVDLVIDAVAGIGGRAGLSGAVATFAEACRGQAVPVLSVDIPSGLVADSHLVAESFHATQTITFAAEKLCHVARPAADRCGRVHVADIGIDQPDVCAWQTDVDDLRRWWPVPDATSDKYSRGVVGLDTGSADYPGAAVLGALGAVNAGAGMVRYLGPASGLMLAAVPSAVCRAGRVSALVLGSGWGAPDEARWRAALASDVPLVVDAEALVGLPDDLPSGSLLTPHAGELARLLGVERSAVVNDPVAHAAAAASRHSCHVLLKGATQYVVRPHGEVVLAVPGPAWAAQAGSGDVLAGMCGALLAAGVPTERAGVLAASLQALTGHEHPGPHAPDAVAGLMPGVLAALLTR